MIWSQFVYYFQPKSTLGRSPEGLNPHPIHLLLMDLVSWGRLFCDSVRNVFCGSVSQKLLLCGSVGQKILFYGSWVKNLFCGSLSQKLLLWLSDSDREQFLWLSESETDIVAHCLVWGTVLEVQWVKKNICVLCLSDSDKEQFLWLSESKNWCCGSVCQLAGNMFLTCSGPAS